MRFFEDYFALQKAVHDYFGYTEDWRILPLVDNREYYWRIVGGEGRGGVIHYAGTIADLNDEAKGNYYEATVYTQRHLPKWVYRAEVYTLVSMDTHSDFNQFLGIFANDREVKPAF